MKNEPGEGMTILGSGRSFRNWRRSGLIDEHQVVVYPVVLGKGRTMFDGIKEVLSLKWTFGNGSVLLCYEPMA